MTQIQAASGAGDQATRFVPGREPVSLLFAGVGGQGVLLVSEMTALAAIEAGYDAKQTEIHGVSQRGGSVHSHVRFGAKVHSPLISPGEAHIVAGLEKLETMRFAGFCGPGGVVVLNDHEIPPVSAGTAAQAAYPHDAADRLRAAGHHVVAIPATRAALDLGTARAANVVLLGYVSALLPMPLAIWEELLEERVPARYLAVNRRAFAVGRNWAEGTTPLPTREVALEAMP